MKAEDFKALTTRQGKFVMSTLSDLQLRDIYASLKKLEELEKPKEIKYRLTRDIPSLGARKGMPVKLEHHKWHCYNPLTDTDCFIGVKDTVDPTLIEEVKPVEIWVWCRSNGIRSVCIDQEEIRDLFPESAAASFKKFIQVEEE